MFIVTLTYTAPLERIDAYLEAHRAWLGEQYARGLFLMSGRKEPRDGGIIIAHAASRTELEAVLRDDLSKLRSLIDQYAADKQKLPQSLDELVSAGYMREIPKDPITGQPDWQVTTGDDPNSSSGEQGVTDVHSASSDVSSEGTPYNEW